jgi:alkylation response protein AidB-like acyl-CoA dehydrogenase
MAYELGGMYDEDGGEFRRDLRALLEEEIDPVVDEADREPLTREEFIEYTGVLRELDIGFEPGVAERYFGNLERFAIVSEELSKVWPSLNVALQMSFPSVFVRNAARETREAMLPKLETGECIGCLAVTEPEGGSDTARPNTVASKDGDEYVLKGRKAWAGNAPIADVALVVAHDDEADAQDMFLVDRESSPFETETMQKLGWTGVRNGRMYFDEVRVPEDNRLSNIVGNALMEGKDLQEIVPFPESVANLFFQQKALNATFSFMRTGMSFMAVGIMQAAFDEALDYVHERETFGRPIGENQLVQEKLYEILRDLATARPACPGAAQARRRTRPPHLVAGEGVHVGAVGRRHLQRPAAPRRRGAEEGEPPGALLPRRERHDHPRRHDRDPEARRRQGADRLQRLLARARSAAPPPGRSRARETPDRICGCT